VKVRSNLFSGNNIATSAASRHTTTLPAPTAPNPPAAKTGAATIPEHMAASTPADCPRPIRVAYFSVASMRCNSSYTSASKAPDVNAHFSPHSTKPTANTQNNAYATHSPNAAAVSSGPTIRRRRREEASAHAPDGTSKAMLEIDQMTNSDEICHTDNPESLNSSVYTGYSSTKSSRNR
jgi:hypothetical protein